MSKLRLILWIIFHCDGETFRGMRWHDRRKGIFCLYWKHQSSACCKKNKSEASDNYDYYTAWAIYKNNLGKKEPRELKAAFRNALEKKVELERVELEMVEKLDPKEFVYWRIKNISEFETRTAQPLSMNGQVKSLSARSKKSTNSSKKNSVQDNCEFDSTSNASTSNAFEGFTTEIKEAPKSITKGRKHISRKIPPKTKKPPAKKQSKNSSQTSIHDPVADSSSVEYGDSSNKSTLPPISILFAGNKSACPSWNDSLRNMSPSFPPPSQNSPDMFCMANSDENLWTPQIFSDKYSPSGHYSNAVPISTEISDFSSPSQTMPYSFKPTPPQQSSDVLLENNRPKLMNTLVTHDVESIILKYSSPYLIEASSNQLYQNNKSANPPITTNYSRPEIAPLMTFTSLLNSQPSIPVSSDVFAFESEQRTRQPSFGKCSLDQQLNSNVTSVATLGSDAFPYAMTPSPEMFPDEPETFPKYRAAQNDGITDYQCSEMFENSTQMHYDSITSDFNFSDIANRLLDNLLEKNDGLSDQLC